MSPQWDLRVMRTISYLKDIMEVYEKHLQVRALIIGID